jgi:hypothetical protein
MEGRGGGMGAGRNIEARVCNLHQYLMEPLKSHRKRVRILGGGHAHVLSCINIDHDG